MTYLLEFARAIVRAPSQLRRTPVAATASIATLALGIGATTAIFSIAYGLLLRPLPYRDADALVQVNAVNVTDGRLMNFSEAEFADWVARARTFEGLALFTLSPFTVTGLGDAEAIPGAIVSEGFFTLLGMPPLVGRALGHDEDAAPNVVVSHRFWRRRFNSDPSIVGRSVTLNGRPYTVTGVAGPQLRFPADDIDVWTSLGYAKTVAPQQWKMRGFRSFSMIARLKSGTGLDQARADVAETARWLARTYPRFNEELDATVAPLRDRLTESVRPAVLMLFGAVGLMLLVACANLANLSLARYLSRRREFAVRTAMGASRGALIAQLLAESAVLAVAGGALGLLVADWSLRALINISPAELPRIDDIRLDAPVLLFTLGLSVLTTFLFGTLPAVHASRVHPIAALKEVRGGLTPAARRVRAALIVTEIAVSVVLLLGGTLLIRSLINLLRSDVGVQDTGVLTLKLNLSSNAPADPDRQSALVSRVLREVGGIPGVQAVGVISSLPPNLSQMRTSFSLPDKRTGAEQDFSVAMISAAPDVFKALGVRLLSGRSFSSADTADNKRVVILSEVAAKRFFPDVDAVGRSLAVGGRSPAGSDREVVGVVSNVKYSGLDAAPDGAVYMPYEQQSFNVQYLVVRVSGAPLAAAPAVRQVIAQVDPALAVSSVRPLETVRADSVAQPRFRAWLLMLLAAVTLAVVAVGLGGVIAHTVSERTAEIGLRMALGAGAPVVLLMVLRQSLWLALGGVTLGMAASYALGRTLAKFLFGISATDVGSFALVALWVLAICLLASLGPARRAANVDPLLALRVD